MATLKETPRERPSVVLVGIDFSESSREALLTAENLARAAPLAELHLVHAFTTPSIPADPQELFARAQTVLSGRLAEAQSKLDKMAAAASHGISRVTGHTRVGSPAAVIVQVASDISADLIVVGSSERAGVSRLVFGSVAEKVARTAPCPVLVARPKEIPMWERIEPLCPDCADVQRSTNGQKLWCARHSQHHPRWHTYYESPFNYGIGSMTFRN
jgi:nucleotide-binding universal stress UspA family protein